MEDDLKKIAVEKNHHFKRKLLSISGTNPQATKLGLTDVTVRPVHASSIFMSCFASAP
jgi:hypothetical protein